MKKAYLALGLLASVSAFADTEKYTCTGVENPQATLIVDLASGRALFTENGSSMVFQLQLTLAKQPPTHMFVDDSMEYFLTLKPSADKTTATAAVLPDGEEDESNDKNFTCTRE